MDDIPVHVGALWPTRDAAIGCPRGDLALRFCEASGLLYNGAFEPALASYEMDYDNALHHSAVFRSYERRLAARLVRRRGDRHGRGRIVEIGCGSGHFLGLICRMSGAEGIGFDPSHDPARADPLVRGRGTITQGYFPPDLGPEPIDLIVLRHVLEHIADPLPFVEQIRDVMRTETTLYIEVPNANLIVERLSIADLIYEHCSYFTKESLTTLVQAAGLEVRDRWDAYGDQFVGVEARLPPPGARIEQPDLDALRTTVGTFPERFGQRLDGWRDQLTGMRGRVVAWGAGAKAIGFFNLLGISSEVAVVVDVNPTKQGNYLPGTGQAIIAPEMLAELQPDHVLVMNPIYVDEISAMLSGLGLDTQVSPV